MKLWLTAQEIADLALDGFPSTKRGVQKLADREEWANCGLARKREGREGGGGLEYHIDLLPLPQRLQYAGTFVRVEREDYQTETTNELTRRECSVRDAKLIVLKVSERFRKTCGMGGNASDHLFTQLFEDGKVPLPEWVLENVKSVSRRSLARWRKDMREDINRLAHDPSKARKGTGVLDRAEEGEVRAYCLATYVTNQFFSAKHIRNAAVQRFGDTVLVDTAQGQKRVPMPPLRTFQNALKGWKDEDKNALLKLTDPDAYKSQVRFSATGANRCQSLNERWEIDASPSDVMTTDGRMNIYVAIDLYSRRTVILITQTPRAAAVGLLIRKCLMAWGVPETIKTDILVNLLPAMRRGEWGYVDNGTTVDLYFWPIDPLNVDVNIEYSRRGTCVEAKSKSFLEFRSIILERASSAGEKNDGHYAFNAGNSVGASPYAADITMENCWIRDTYRSESSYAPVWARHVNNFKLIQCTISDAVNQFGMQITGPFWNEYDGPVTGVWVDRNVVLRSDQTPFRCYGLEGFMVTRNHGIDCGQAAHANKGNIYNGGHNGLWWHNYWWACPGYWTFQRSSAQFFGFNFCPGNTLDTDGRAIEDQNYESTVVISQLSPATGRTIGGTPTNGDCYFLNNMLPPWRNAASYANALLAGRGAETAIRMVVMNNVANGITLRMGMVVADGVRRNVITNGTTNDATDVITPFGDIFEDILLGDLAIKPDSPHLTGTSHPINVLPGHDGTRILSDVFPDYDGFGVDIAGKPIDLANPPVGCVGDPADLHQFDPVWIVRPKLTGAPVVGGSVSADDGYIMAFGHSLRTYQWYLVDDVYDPRIDWTPIAGANSAAYSPQSGDIGKYLARRTEMDGVPIYSLMDAPVAAAFPLGNPVSLLNPRSSSDVSVGANTWFETAQITTSNKPLLVVVNSNNVTFARVAAFSATIGAAGRNGGEGTPLTVDPGTALRTRNQISFATILAPGTGAQTIQVSNDDGWSNIHVSVFEIDGMDSIVVGGEIEASNPLSLSPAITTGQINTLVFYAANRYDGTEDPLSWEGGTALLSEPTGAGGASTSLWAAMAFEQAASTGNYSQTVSWLSQQGAATSCAVEIRAAA